MAEVLERARDLGHEVFAPIAAEGEPRRLNRPLVRALGEHGLLELVFAGSAVELCELREGLAHGCTEAETALALQGLGGYPILSRGRPELREEWIPRLSRGEVVAAFALSEPEAGSDAANLGLRADRDGDGFRLTGTKLWISNAPEADVYSVFARTSGSGAKGITAFAVPRESEGLSGQHLDLLAPHPIGRLDFDGVRVGREQLLGDVDGGFAVATEIEAARLLVREAAARYDAGIRPVRKESAMAKLFATEAAQRAVDAAVQVHGARALEKGHLLEHLYREVRAPRIYEGASEVQREIIARELFKGAQ